MKKKIFLSLLLFVLAIPCLILVGCGQEKEFKYDFTDADGVHFVLPGSYNAAAGGFEIAYDNIEERAWVELESVGITKESLKANTKKLSHEEIVAHADEIVPGITDGKLFKVADICKNLEAEI